MQYAPGAQDPFARVKPVKPAPKFELIRAFEQDKAPKKINLLPRASNDTPSRPYSFQPSRQAQLEVSKDNLDKDYIPMVGDSKFNLEAQKLIFGEKLHFLSDKIVTIETVSGTNAFRIIFQFLKDFFGKEVFIPNLAWDNLATIPQKAGFRVNRYPYFNPKAKEFNFKGMYETLRSLVPGSIIVLPASSYNLSGVEPSANQWRLLASLFKSKGFIAIFDCTGQGLASGDLRRDITSVHTFLEEGAQAIICQDLTINLGIYGERVGALHMLCRSKSVADKVMDQLKPIVRTMYSNPPCNGGWVAVKLLTKQDLKIRWEAEIKAVAERYNKIRRILYNELKEIGEKSRWEYLLKHNGPFCEQREMLRKRYHIYVAPEGIINLVIAETCLF